MFAKSRVAALTALALLGACTASAPAGRPGSAATSASFADWQSACAGPGDGRDAWTIPAPPFRVSGNTWYVGTCGIASLLVTTTAGNVLVDSGMPEAAPLVAANIERLGFEIDSIKAMLSSHEHLDHVGATSILKAQSGAMAVGLDLAVTQLESGKPLAEDPQLTIIPVFDGFKVDRVVRDGETVRLGDTTFTAHSTPAHTPGSTAWTWRSCGGADCALITYADSLSTPASDDYRFSDHPDYVAQVRRGFARAAALPCGILLTPHPSASGMAERFSEGPPRADAGACKAYADAAAARFEERLAEEVKGG